jgi:hypothetical protein
VAGLSHQGDGALPSIRRREVRRAANEFSTIRTLSTSLVVMAESDIGNLEKGRSSKLFVP